MREIDELNDDEIFANEPLGQLRRNQRRLLYGGIIVLLAVVIGVQFLPARLPRDNPQVIQEPPWDSEVTRELAVRACYDCHSNETVWPWYSYIAPLSWMILYDVHTGREVLNFSEWTPEHIEDVEAVEAVELISKGTMPLAYYEILHPEASLTVEEEGLLINGLIESMRTSPDEILRTDELDEED